MLIRLYVDDILRVVKLDNSITFMKVIDEAGISYEVAECDEAGQLLPNGVRRSVTCSEVSRLKPYWEKC